MRLFHRVETDSFTNHVSPGAMGLAATRSIELTQQVTNASAKEMKIAGINWAYACSIFAYVFLKVNGEMNTDTAQLQMSTRIFAIQ